MQNTRDLADEEQGYRPPAGLGASSYDVASVERAMKANPHIFPLPLSAAAIQDFKRVIFLDIGGDPETRRELNKLKAKWPLEGQLYDSYMKVPQLRAYKKTLRKSPRCTNPGTFNIPLFTEGADSYSIRIIPGGDGVTIPPGVVEYSFNYTLYFIKTTRSGDDNEEQESVIIPEEDRRFVLEYENYETPWCVAKTFPGCKYYPINATCNYRIKDKKKNKTVYELTTLRTIGDAVRANEAKDSDWGVREP